MSNHIFFSGFCGGGGATLGAKQAGIKKTIGVESDEEIAEIYRRNVGECVTADITQLDLLSLNLPSPEERNITGDLIIWQLSPPCQDHSAANKKKNKKSKRATILEKIFSHEQVIKPDWIILENVKGYKNAECYQNFCGYLRGRGYRVEDFILNSADFGVPQSRERLIMIASKSEVIPQIKTTHKRSNGQMSLFNLPWVGWYKAIQDLIPGLPESKLTDKQKQAMQKRGIQVSEPGCLMATKFLDRNGHLSVEANQPAPTVTAIGASFQPILVERIGYRNDQPKIAEASDPCWTIRATLSDDGKAKEGRKSGTRTKVIDVVEGADVRSLNTKALARLQSFPDSYQWSGKMALDVKVIGNSVPPLMMQRIIESILAV